MTVSEYFSLPNISVHDNRSISRKYRSKIYYDSETNKFYGWIIQLVNSGCGGISYKIDLIEK